MLMLFWAAIFTASRRRWSFSRNLSYKILSVHSSLSQPNDCRLLFLYAFKLRVHRGIDWRQSSYALPNLFFSIGSL